MRWKGYSTQICLITHLWSIKRYNAIFPQYHGMPSHWNHSLLCVFHECLFRKPAHFLSSLSFSILLLMLLTEPFPPTEIVLLWPINSRSLLSWSLPLCVTRYWFSCLIYTLNFSIKFSLLVFQPILLRSLRIQSQHSKQGSFSFLFHVHTSNLLSSNCIGQYFQQTPRAAKW